MEDQNKILEDQNKILSQIIDLKERLSEKDFRDRALDYFPVGYPALMEQVNRCISDPHDWSEDKKNILYDEGDNIILSVAHLDKGPSPV